MVYDLLKQASDAIVVLSLKEEEILFYNESCKKLLGIDTPEEEIIAIPIEKFLLSKTDCEKVLAEISGRLKKESLFCLSEVALCNQEGNVFSCQIKGGYYNEEKQHIYAMIFLNNNVDHMFNYLQVANDIPTGIAVIGYNERLTLHYGNKAFFDHFHTTEAGFYELYHDEIIQTCKEIMRTSILESMKAQITSTKSCSLKLEIDLKNGMESFWIQLDGVLLSAEHNMIDLELWCIIRQTEKPMNMAPYHSKDDIVFFNALHVLTNDVLFRLDIQTGIMNFMGNLQTNFSDTPVMYNFPQSIIENGLIPADDIPAFLIMAADVFRGVETPTYFRMNTEDGRSDWYLVEYIILKDDFGVPKEAVGKISNVQKQKTLEKLIDLDPLTQCLNKIAFERAVTQNLGSHRHNVSYAFLIIDVDNFKAVNDNLGHHFGDEVLKDVSSALKKIFRDTDLVGRIGGDEFTVFLMNVPDDALLAKKAREIITAFDREYVEQDMHYRITCSIGIAKYPKDGMTYEDLYKNADIALYRSKNNGKNNFTMYSSNFVDQEMGTILPIELSSKLVWKNIEQHIILKVKRLLFQTYDIHEGIQKVLDELATSFYLEESYLLEVEIDGEEVRKLRKWCANNEWKHDVEECGGYVNEFLWKAFAEDSSTESLLYCSNFKELKPEYLSESFEEKELYSVCYLYSQGEHNLHYILGTNTYTKSKTWKPMEVCTVAYLMRILSEFLAYTKFKNLE